MPRVPTYDAPQVEAAPLRVPNATPELLGEPARQQLERGKALLDAGGGLSKIAAVVQERENTDSVLRAETALKEDLIGYERDVLENRRGRFATGVTKDSEKWWQDTLKKHTDALGNNEQRRVFSRRTTDLRLRSLETLSRHEILESQKSALEARTASTNTSVGYAATSPTQANIEAAKDQVIEESVMFSRLHGWSPEKTKAHATSRLTELHTQVIEGLAVKDPVAAKEYFEKHKGEIDGAKHAELGKFASDATATAIGGAVADALWGKHGPKTDTAPVNLDEMEKQAREALGGNEPAIKAAISALRERTQAFDKGTQEREAANAAAVAQADLAGKSIREIRGMPEFLALSGTKQREMVEHMESVRYAREQRARARSDDAEVRKNSAAYFQYSDPTTLRGMSRNQVAALLPKLGRIYTEHLLTKWDALQKTDEKIHEATIDADDFNRVAHGAGLKPFDTKKSEEEKAALGELKFQVEQRIDAEQEKAKRKLTRTEKQMIMQQEIDNRVLVDRPLWFDSEKPVVLLSPGEMKDAYVMVDGQRVNISSIPATDRAEIIKARQARRLPVTEADIARTWLQAKQKRPAPAEQTPAAPSERPGYGRGRSMGGVPQAGSDKKGAAFDEYNRLSTEYQGLLTEIQEIREDPKRRSEMEKRIDALKKRVDAAYEKWRGL